ncbi:MAG: hypothetical protein QW531_04870 [Thermoplasmata archaeon]
MMPAVILQPQDKLYGNTLILHRAGSGVLNRYARYKGLIVPVYAKINNSRHRSLVGEGYVEKWEVLSERQIRIYFHMTRIIATPVAKQKLGW